MNATASVRLTAEERREAILEASLVCFADHGAHGMSTEAIAKAVGISQPYIFRLFGTKKELVKATIERCMSGTLELFRTAAAGLSGEEAKDAIGRAYRERVSNPTYLRAQMQSYVACEDPEIRTVVRRGFGELVEYIERATGLPPDRVAQAFAHAMLLNVLAAMHLDDDPELWAQRLFEGSKGAT
jgi:AcrR family transcriptional regulator